MILLMEASISSMEGSRCTLLAVAIVTSAALVTRCRFPVRQKPDSNHGDSVTDGSPYENPQSEDRLDFNRLGHFDIQPTWLESRVRLKRRASFGTRGASV
jgi:hypothetical protein